MKISVVECRRKDHSATAVLRRGQENEVEKPHTHCFLHGFSGGTAKIKLWNFVCYSFIFIYSISDSDSEDDTICQHWREIRWLGSTFLCDPATDDSSD